MNISRHRFDKNLFFLVIFLSFYFFHLFRNISFIYIFILFILFIYGINKAIKSQKKIPKNTVSISFALYLFTTCYVLAISLIEPSDSVAGDLPKLFIAPLAFAILYFLINKLNEFILATDIFFAFYILSVFSLIYQLIFGPISWFAPSSTRGGLVRYSSLLGSLTIYGTTCAIPIIYIFYRVEKSILQLIFFMLITVGAIITMQKAAPVNILIGLFIALMVKKSMKNVTQTIFWICILSIFLYIYALIFPQLTLSKYIANLIVSIFGSHIDVGSAVIIDTQLSSESLWERLQWLGLAITELQDDDITRAVLFGLGVMGAGMGSNAVHPHNSVYEILLMGGVIYLIVFITLFFAIQYSLFKLNDKFSRFLFYSNFVVFLNAIFSSLFFLHPITSFTFWLSLIWILNKYNNKLICNSN